LLLEILRQRGIIFDSEAGKIIDDKSSIETLLRVLQKEKQKKKQQQEEILHNTNKSSKIHMQPYEFINNLLDVNYKLTVRWLLLLALNPFTAWFWSPLTYLL
jgi:hypothetical protein